MPLINEDQEHMQNINGSLLPPDQVLNMLKEYKGQMRISDYDIACEQDEKLKQ